MNRSENMSRIRAKDTRLELFFRKELWKLGLRYRINDKTVFGKPDISIKKIKVAIFCDSEFWHGKKYLHGEVPKKNRIFWINKFKNNITRDKIVNKKLKVDGWLVIRFWSKDIYKNPNKCALKIYSLIQDRNFYNK